MVLLDLTELAAPGWLPLLITGITAVLLVLLWFSMRRQMRRIEVPVDEMRPDSAPFADDTGR